jgi:hypothetical protein
VKRLISILFIAVYASTAFATTYDFHFCHGKMMGSALLNISGHPKCCCGDADKAMNGCCKDEIKICKADCHRTTQSVTTVPLSLDLALPAVISLHFAPTFHIQSSRLCQLNPWQSSAPVYLLNKVLRI